jgi:hypothetical protein
MGFGEAIRGLGQLPWPRQPGLNNGKPRLEDRQPGSYNPSEAKTPGEALSYIAVLYKSGRMEDLAKLLRRSQVFRVAWLMLQQSSPEVFEGAEEVTGSARPGQNQELVCLPAPDRGPARVPLRSEPGPPGPGPDEAESFPQLPGAAMDSGPGNSPLTITACKTIQPRTRFFQVYLSQDRYRAREKQLGQLISLRA